MEERNREKEWRKEIEKKNERKREKCKKSNSRSTLENFFKNISCFLISSLFKLTSVSHSTLESRQLPRAMNAR